MSRQITGRATVQVDGERLLTENGATLDPGGTSREAVTGGGEVQGYRESDSAPSLSVPVRHHKEVNLKRLNELIDATVIFETDTGRQWILRGAFTTNTLSLDVSAGNFTLEMSAMQVDESES